MKEQEQQMKQMQQRIDNTPSLEPYSDLILYDWDEGRDHAEWITTADEQEILDWCVTNAPEKW